MIIDFVKNKTENREEIKSIKNKLKECPKGEYEYEEALNLFRRARCDKKRYKMLAFDVVDSRNLPVDEMVSVQKTLIETAQEVKRRYNLAKDTVWPDSGNVIGDMIFFPLKADEDINEIIKYVIQKVPAKLRVHVEYFDDFKNLRPGLFGPGNWDYASAIRFVNSNISKIGRITEKGTDYYEYDKAKK